MKERDWDVLYFLNRADSTIKYDRGNWERSGLEARGIETREAITDMLT